MVYAYIKLLSDKGYKEAGYRLTLFDKDTYYKNKQYYQEVAVTKLCIARGWTLKDLQVYGYNKIKVFFREVE